MSPGMFLSKSRGSIPSSLSSMMSILLDIGRGSWLLVCLVILLYAHAHLTLKFSKNSSGEGTLLGVGANLRPSSKALIWGLVSTLLDRLSTGEVMAMVVEGWEADDMSGRMIAGCSLRLCSGEGAACGGVSITSTTSSSVDVIRLSAGGVVISAGWRRHTATPLDTGLKGVGNWVVVGDTCKGRETCEDGGNTEVDEVGSGGGIGGGGGVMGRGLCGWRIF